MENERDILLFTDEDGQEVEMEVLDYFVHDGEEYALLSPIDDEEHPDDCDCGCGELYIMKVVVNGDTEEFVPVDEDKMEELMETVEALYEDADEEDYYEYYKEDNDVEDEK
jgi:Protein of unknown function (DUF1292).